MSIISRLLLKIWVALRGGHDYEVVYDTDDEYDIPHTPNKDVQNYLDYPSKPTGITLYSEREILSVHSRRIQDINMYIGLPNSELSDEAYTLTNLVIKPLMEFTRWIHLLPASENHHHAGTGGLLSHSLETAFLSLKFAYSTELRPIGLQDEEQIRKRRYLYAAFICGLLHDAGKIFDVDVISTTPGIKSTWRPLSESLMDWANANRIMAYEVIWRKRSANDHSVRAAVFLERCLNDTCLNYLSDVVKERMYDKMLASLGNYTTSDDFISRCMRTADWHSTGTDTSYRYDKQSGIRTSDTAARAISVIKDNIGNLNINGFDSSAVIPGNNTPSPVHIMIIGGAVYINEHTALDFILNQFKRLGVNFPDGDIGRKSLTDLLLNGGYIESYGEQRIAHFFHRGEFSESDIQKMFNDGIKGLSWYSLLKIKWVGFLFQYDVIPESVPGIFSINETNDYLYVDRKGNDTLYTRPPSQGMKAIRLGSNFAEIPVTVTIDKQQEKANAQGTARTDSVVENTTEAKQPEISSVANNAVTDAKADTGNIASEVKPDVHQESKKRVKTDKKQKKKSEISNEEYIARLQHHCHNNAIPPHDLALIDGVLYVSVEFINGIAPLDEVKLMESELFVLSLRTGSLDEEFSVPAQDGRRYVQLTESVSLTQLRNQPDIKEVEMLPLLSADLFGGVKSDDVPASFSFPQIKEAANPVPLPPERYEEEVSEQVVNLHDHTNIPVTAPPYIQEDASEQSWADYEMYFQGESAFQSSGESPSSTAASLDVSEQPVINSDPEPELSQAGGVIDALDSVVEMEVETEEEVDASEDEDESNDANRGFEALFTRQTHIISAPPVVIAQNQNDTVSMQHTASELHEVKEHETLQADIDTIVCLLNRVRINNNSSHIRVLQRFAVVSDINFCLRVRIIDDINSWGFSPDELSRLKTAIPNFPVAPLKVAIGQPIRHYMIRLRDLQEGALRNNIFFEEFISFFNHLDGVL